MNNLLSHIAHGIAGVALAVASFFGAPQTPAPVAGSFTPVGGNTYYLSGAGINATQTTIQLTSFQTPDGRNLTMSMFGQIGYAALEPGTSKLEDITFSGITQNTNGTATLTGVTRGNDFVSPYAATPSLAKAHAGGSALILSNTAGFYGQQFLFANNAGTSTATITFSSTTPPVYENTTQPTTITANLHALTDVNTVDYLVNLVSTSFWAISGNDIHNTNSGAVNINNMSSATSTFYGPIQFLGTHSIPYLLMATGSPPYGEIAGDLIDAGYSQNGFAAINTFNTYSGSCATSNFVMNGNIGSLNSDYTDIGFTNTGWTGVGAGCLSPLTGVKPESTYIYQPTGDMDFVTGSTTPNQGTFNWFAKGGALSNKIMSLDSLGNLTLNNVTYTFPSTQAVASSSSLCNDNTGKLSWCIPERVFALNGNSNSPSVGTGTTSVQTITIPANTLGGTNQQVRLTALFVKTVTDGNGCTTGISFGNGSASTSIAYSKSLTNLNEMNDFSVNFFATSTTAQAITSRSLDADSAFSSNSLVSGAFLTSVNLATQTYFSFDVKCPSSNTAKLASYTMEILTK